MAERFQRQYGVVQPGSDGREQMHANIAAQLGGFKSQAASLGADIARRQGVAKAKTDAAAYTGDQAPELKKRTNTAAQTYNALVMKTYQTQVENRALARVGELAEQYKNQPVLFQAAIAQRRKELINEAGESAGLAVVAFDTIAGKADAAMRAEMMKSSRETSIREHNVKLTNLENVIMDYAADGGADPAVMDELIKGWDAEVEAGQEFGYYTSDKRQLMAMDLRKRAVVRVYDAELNDYLDKGDYQSAAKWIQSIRNRQITTGKMSEIMKTTGQTPEQLAEELALRMKAHGEITADAIGQESKQRSNRESALATRGREEQKILVDLGSNLTVDDVIKARPFLDNDEYRQWRERAEGKPPEVNSLAFNQLYQDTMLAVNAEDYDALAEQEEEAVDLFRRGRMSRAEYESLRDLSQASRFGPGMDLFDGLSKAAQQLGKMASTMGLVRARRDFELWMKRNPGATPEQADAKATAFVDKYIPSLLKAVTGVEDSMAQAQKDDAEVGLYERYRRKHNGDRDAIANDPDYLRELEKLQNGT